MKAYRKLIVAVVGMIVLLTNDYLGIDLQGSEDQLVDVVIALLTAVGIYEFENEIKEVS